MRNIIKSIILALALIGMMGIPTAHASESAEDFLRSILTADFSGDGESRIGRSVYSDGKSEIVDEGSSRAEVDITTDPIAIVSSWSIVAVYQFSPTGYRIEADFHTVAASWKGDDDTHHLFREIVALPIPVNEVVAYIIVKRHGKWKLLDPPNPRIALPPVLKAMTDSLELETKLQQEARNAGDTAAVHWRDGYIAYDVEEIQALKALDVK